MRPQRVLMMTHEDLLPPTDISNLSEAELAEVATERDVFSTLSKLGHEVRVIGVGNHLTELRDTLRDWRPHLVFNLLEEYSGIAAYDYYVVAFLELMQQRYTGCNPRGLMLSRDKVLTKQVLAWHRIDSPAFQLFPYGRRFREPTRLRYPLFVKSSTEDASRGIAQASIVDDLKSLRERVEFIHEHVQTDALVEEYVEGRELYIGVMGNTRLTTLPVWEMKFGSLIDVQAGIATRKVKWDRRYQQKHGITTGPAEDLNEAEAERLGRIAKRIYRALHMSGFARMDFRLREDGRLFVLEANANPNLANDEDFAESAKRIGIPYDSLIARILSIGLGYMPEWRMFES